MEFEYRAYQKIKRELQNQQRRIDAGEKIDNHEMIANVQDLMEMVEALRFQDQELGVYNHVYWMNKIAEAIAKGRMDLYDACYFNLKRFALVNNLYGRDVGTKIMKRFVTQLQDMLTPDEFVCRIGGDNFAMFFYKEHLPMVMEYLQGTEISVGEATAYIEACAGYYDIPQMTPISEPSQVFDRVSEAMQVAKNMRRVPYLFWNEDMMNSQENRKKIEGIFHECLDRGEFIVYYQPKVDLRDYSLIGAEALCRWKHDGKIIPPNDFIPILEQSRNICDLDFHVLESVCKDIRRWCKEGREVVKVSVNLSRRHMEDMDLLERIFDVIDDYGVPHQYIEIELTETTTDVEFKDLRRIVSGLQIRNISTSVDDFGVGYSSLNLIRELPWNVLKIDKSFLPEVQGSDNKKDLIFRQLVLLAQSLGLECIVEGVETVEQIRILKKNNCFLAQGYYFDRPLPVDVFEQRLDANVPFVRRLG